MKNRKHIRLKGYDYKQNGYYFVTICTQDRIHLFGEIQTPVGADPRIGPNNDIPRFEPNNHDPDIGPIMKFNDIGKMVDEKIREMNIYDRIYLDNHCVMPNHIHMIIVIVGADPRIGPNNGIPYHIGPPQGAAPTLGEFVKRFKTLTTRIYIENVKNNNWPRFNKRLWQRNYYERIIRNENELYHVRKYIQNNPEMWWRDRNNM